MGSRVVVPPLPVLISVVPVIIGLSVVGGTVVAGGTVVTSAARGEPVKAA